MRYSRVFVYGSEASLQVAQKLDRGLFQLVGAVTGQSFISSYTKPVEIASPPTFGHAYYDNQIRADYASSLRHDLSTLGPEIDVLIFDLLPEIDGIYVLPDGSVVSRSPAFVRAGGEQSLPLDSRYVPYGTPQHFEYWHQASIAIGRLVTSLAPKVIVIALDAPCTAEQREAIAPRRLATSFEKVQQKYLAQAASALGARVVSRPPVIAGAEAYLDDDSRAVVQMVQQTIFDEPPIDSKHTPKQPVPTNSGLTQQPSSTPNADRAGSKTKLNTADLVGRHWRMSRETGTHAVEPLLLRRDGTILGSTHPNESLWRANEDAIQFFDDRGNLTTVFDQVTVAGTRMRLEGWFVKDSRYSIRHVLETVDRDWGDHPGAVDTSSNKFLERCVAENWALGRHIVGEPSVVTNGGGTLQVGSFCVFGKDVTILMDEIVADRAAAYRFERSWRDWPGAALFTEAKAQPLRVSIGNDVTIGRGATILAGVTIGDGAVIYPGAMVTDDVEPYAIVAGNPAVPLGLRFPLEQVRRLLDIRWWEWPDEMIDSLIPTLAGRDVGELFRAVESLP